MAYTLVPTELIADSAVTSAKIANGTIATVDIADDAITSAKIDTNIAIAGSLSVAGTLTANAGINIDNINIDGTTIALSSGDLVLDSAGDIILDAANNDIILKDAGTTFGQFTNDSGQLIIYNAGSQMLKGNSGSNALFVGNVTAVGTSVFTNLDISGDVDIDGTLETDALSIASTTVTSSAAELNFSDGVTSNIQTQLNTKATTGKAIAMALVFG